MVSLSRLKFTEAAWQKAYTLRPHNNHQGSSIMLGRGQPQAEAKQSLTGAENENGALATFGRSLSSWMVWHWREGGVCTGYGPINSRVNVGMMTVSNCSTQTSRTSFAVLEPTDCRNRATAIGKRCMSVNRNSGKYRVDVGAYQC
jgi:hypothetical protein